MKRIPNWFIAFIGMVILFAGMIYYAHRAYKAETCNRAFRLWFYYNHGVNINIDKFYEDAQKWVYDPQYIPEDFK